VQITIGIPSYNEQLGIANLLKSIETQITNEHQISEIIISDDSEDNTPDIVNDIARSSKMNITLIHHNKRRGAASAWNEIFANANGEIIVLYDADVIPDTKTTLLLASNINERVALCAANPLPISQKGIAAKATAFNSSWLRRVRKAGLSQYTVMGRALSIRKDVARQITIPNIIAIDLYLQCKMLEQGYRIHYSDDAVVWFKPPTTLLDFTSQVARAMRGHEEISGYVKKFNIDLPSSALLKEAIKEALSDPAGMFAVAVSYAAFPLYKMKISNGKEQAIWHVADSTKGITIDDLHGREPRK
jgi:cellulose synthase/poly-beta-1,6-N-acetylglucosamine synthase-like glycosyltransferase